MKTNQITMVAIFTVLVIIGAYIRIPTGYIVVTLQPFFVVLAGLILDKKYAYIVGVTYMMLGIIGLPVFSTGAGIGSIFSPSFGYILGFILCIFITSNIVSNNHNKKLYIIASIIGIACIYIIGVLYMYIIMNYYLDINISVAKSVYVGCIVFLPKDILMSVICANIAYKLKPKINISR